METLAPTGCVDATIVAALQQGDGTAEKVAFRAGRGPDGWVEVSEATPRPDGVRPVDLAILAFGYESLISFDGWHGPVWPLGDQRCRRPRLRPLGGVPDWGNTARDAADSALRPAKHEALLANCRLRLRIHRSKPRGQAMAERTRRAVLARRADGAGGAHHRHHSAHMKIGGANLTFNVKR